jgi:hypothetical protein
MNDRTLSEKDIERGPVREKLSHLQHIDNIEGQARERVDEAMKAAVAHVEKTQGLQYGMQGKHIDKALDFLDKHYEGRHDLKPAERDFIEKSFNSYFDELGPKAEPSDES